MAGAGLLSDLISVLLKDEYFADEIAAQKARNYPHRHAAASSSPGSVRAEVTISKAQGFLWSPSPRVTRELVSQGVPGHVGHRELQHGWQS